MSKESEKLHFDYEAAQSEQEYYIAANRVRHRKHHFPILPVVLGALLFVSGFIIATFCMPNNPDPEDSVLSQGSNDATSSDDSDDSTPDEQNPTEPEWNLILVNSTHPLSEDFEIPELTQLRNNMTIDKRAYPALQKMMDDARAEGLQPLIISSFRTWDKQEELFTIKTQEYIDQGFTREEAEHMASFWVARPGTSEHHTGLAVDIVDENFRHLDERQESTAVQQWLIKHCAEYGFILRYPTDKSEITGIGYEPWHYRYVGVDTAKEIMSKGICLEEYLSDYTS